MTLTPAEELFNEVGSRMLSHFVSTMCFVEVGNAGIPAAFQERVSFLTEYYRNLAENDAGKELIASISPDRLAEIIVNSAKNQVFNFQKGVHAAGVVFAHSILDGIVIDLCRVCGFANPDLFDRYIGQRKVALDTIKTSSYHQIRQEYVSSYLEQLERESLLKKADALHVLSPPKENLPYSIPGYTYDRDKLLELDEIRHGIIHGTDDYPEIKDVRATVKYMAETGWYFVSLVGGSCNYRLPRDFLSNAKLHR